MEFVPKLPPGAWASLKAEEHWQALLERRDSIIQVYRQGVYLSLRDPTNSLRYSNPAFRARIEQEHKAGCDEIEAALKAHCRQSYVLDGGVWESNFEFDWVPIDQS